MIQQMSLPSARASLAVPSWCFYAARFSFLLLLGTGCTEKDETAPPPPNLNPVTTPTSLPVQTLTGSAEYGATVRITGGLENVEVIADPFTAEFRADVGLTTTIPVGGLQATTSLTLTAVDSAGNVSDALTVEVAYEEPHPEGLILELSKDQITADEGEILATVRTTNDEITDLSGFDVVLTISGVPGLDASAATQTVQTNTSGVARTTFSGLTAVADNAVVTATSGELSDDRTFEIIAGRATTFTQLEMSGSATDGTVEAGEDVTYDYATADAFGNIAEGQILVTVNHPGAVVMDDGISGSGNILGMTKVGSYTINARIAGSGTTDGLDLDVAAASGSRSVDLTLSLTRMAVNNTTLALTVVRDIYGNVLWSPAPTFTIVPQNPINNGEWTQDGNEFTITRSGVYIVTATFNDGANPSASDFEYILVEDIPDLEPPSVAITRINGFAVCPATGLTTDQADLSDCATRTLPALILRRNTFAVLELTARDNLSLTQLAYKAFGSGVSSEDFIFIGDGQYTAETDLVITFSLNVNPDWLGDVTVVGQAIDAAANMANSAPAYIRVRLDLDSSAERNIDVLASGDYLAGIRDVAVAPDGSVFGVNLSNSIPLVYQVDDANGTITTSIDLYPYRASTIAFDGTGNLYLGIDEYIPSRNGVDEIWSGLPGTTPALFLPDQGNGFDSEGMATLGAIPGRGGWEIPQILEDNSCLSIQIGAVDNPTGTRADTYVLQLSSNCGANNNCGGGGALAGLTRNACIARAGSVAQQALEVASHFNTVRATTGMSAFTGNNCFATNNACVFLVADEIGRSPAPTNQLPVAIRSSDGNWGTNDVDLGEDAGVLFVVDRNNDEVLEVQTPPSVGMGVLHTYGVPNVDGNLVNVAAALRMTGAEATADDTRAQRMFLFVTDDANNNWDGVLHGYDSGRDRWWTVKRDNCNNSGCLDQPYGIVYVPGDVAGGGDCLIATTRANNAQSEELLAYTDIDNQVGASLEGGVPMVTGFSRLRGLALDNTAADPANWSLVAVDSDFQAVVRIGRTAAIDDCF